MRSKLRRSFEELRNGTSSDVAPCLSVLQWNVLADGLAQYGDFERVRSPSTCRHAMAHVM